MDDTEEYAPSEEEHSGADTMGNLLNEESPSGVTPPGALSVGPRRPRSSEENTRINKLDSLNRKKRQNRAEESKARAKRRRLNHSDAYRVLLNEVISEARDGVSLIEEEPLKASQIGVTSWSTKEKRVFFAILDRKGRHDLRGIANALHTKSESEVHVYAQLLHQAMVDHHSHSRHHELVGQAGLPAAFEVGQACETALDQDAYGLSVKQLNHEAKLEKQKYGEMWLLNRETAEHLEQGSTNTHGAITEPVQLHSAVELLNLANFLELSERVFMNSFDLQSNWRTYADKEELPSIFCTAFLDLHMLVSSITKRLVESVLYFAVSRLRASDTGSYTHRRMVRKEDVTGALDVLGMKANSREYWAKAARRCNLHVYERFTQSGKPKDKLGYSEAERRIRQAIVSEGGSVSLSSEDEDETNLRTYHAATSSGIDASDQEGSEQSPASSTDSSNLFDDIDPIPTHSARAKHQLRSSERLAKLQDSYVEAFDHQASQKEEQRLWEILGKQQSIQPEDIELPPRPITERKLKDDLVDWRDWIDYRSPWERYETPILTESFRRNRRIGRESRTFSRERARLDYKGDRGYKEDEEDAASSGAENSNDEEELDEDNDDDGNQSQDHNSSDNHEIRTNSPEVRTDDENSADDNKSSEPNNEVQPSIELRITADPRQTTNDSENGKDLPANHSPTTHTEISNSPASNAEGDDGISPPSASDEDSSSVPPSPLQPSGRPGYQPVAQDPIRPFSTMDHEGAMADSSDGEGDPMSFLEDDAE